MIRKRWEAEITRRFNRLKARIREVLSDPDVFGQQSQLVTNAGRFAFRRDDEKVDAFMDWLREQEQSGQIAIINRPQRSGPRALDNRWANIYIDSAYQQGIRRARSELAQAGYDVPTDAGVGAAFNQPLHADRAGSIYSRTYRDLNGITEAMDQQISRVLAQGIVDGKSPIQLAREINQRVDKIGITRARTLARTEVIRAHHTANMAEFRQAGVDGVDVVAEFVTAGDDRVCPECEALASAGPYDLDAAEGLIPAHPNCRCVVVPQLKD
jgi:SPP1 gp7 family putative phage head morphogenesis protein